MEMYWNWLVVTYLFLGGLGAGAYLTSFAVEMGWLGQKSGLKKMGYFIGGPIVGLGTALLVFDLGQGFHKPWLLWRLITNMSSVMTWGTIVLAVFIMVGVLKGYLAFINKPAPRAVTWFGALLATATGAYTGFLVSVIDAIPFWSSNIIPVIFFVSALSTGLSITVLLSHIIEKTESENSREDAVHLGLILAELAAVAVFMGLMVSGANGVVAQKSAALLISGKYAIVFWGIFIGVGLLFPLAVYALRLRTANRTENMTLAAGEMAMTEEEPPKHSYLTIITDAAVLVGGYSLRMMIIFAALPIWDGIKIP